MSGRPTRGGAAGRRTSTCQQCAGQVYWAIAPWGKVMLDPFPDPAGDLRVDVLRAGLQVLGPKDRASAFTKMWARHVCVAQGVRRPAPQAEQLGLF